VSGDDERRDQTDGEDAGQTGSPATQATEATGAEGSPEREREEDEMQARMIGQTPPRAGEVSVSSEQLLRGANRMSIEHNGEIYVLRVTRNGKLILTK